MGFAATSVLWVLPVALLPLAIHWLMRLRSQRRVWGADWVLNRAIARLGRRTDWEQILLILLRASVCAALVVAFARPVAQSAAVLASGSGVHRIIVLDASASMAAAEGGPSRWQASLGLARGLVAGWGRGERWSLLLVGSEPRWVVRDAVIGEPAAAVAILDALRPEEAAVAMGHALAVAYEVAGGGPAEIYLCADDQATAWRDAVSSAPVDPAKVRLVWICPPLADRANCAVVALRLAADQALVGHPHRAVAIVRNLGPAPVDDLPVDFLIDGAIAGSVRVSVQPGQELAVRHDLLFDAPGPRLVAARLPPDVLTSDDQAVAAVAVRSRLHLLVLRDPGRDGALDSAWPLIDAACRVLARSDREGRAIWNGAPLTAALHQGDLTSAPLGEADVVLLDGSRRLADGDGARLTAWVERGGGLVLCADSDVDASRWRNELGSLLPAIVAETQASPTGGPGFAFARPAGEGGPLDAFTGAENGDIGQLNVFTRRPLTPATGSRTVLAFADGTPAAIVRRDGLGAVVLLATGLDGKSGNLAIRETFYPFFTGLLLAAAEGADFRRTVGVGEPLRLRIAGSGMIGATVALGNDQPQTMAVAADGRVAELTGGLTASGPATVLVLRDGGSSRTSMAVQSPPPDSDLTPLVSADRSLLVDRLAMAQAHDNDSLAAVVAAWRGGQERFALVAAIVLLLVFAELLFLRRFD